MQRTLVLGLFLLMGCARAQGAPPPSTQAQPKGDRAPDGPPPLGPREEAFRVELERDVRHLSQKIGERNVDKKWELADAADWIFSELESAGYSVRREGYEVDGIAAQNFEVTVHGERADHEIVVVGAHYDSAQGSPGADDNATGVAAVLALARRFRTATPSRTLRFVLFANEEPPYFQTENMGSVVYTRGVTDRRENVVAMLSLESIGYYNDAPGSQRYPKEIARSFPSVGNFVAVVGDRESSRSRDSGHSNASRLVESAHGRRCARRGVTGSGIFRSLGVLASARAGGHDHGYGALPLRPLSQADGFRRAAGFRADGASRGRCRKRDRRAHRRFDRAATHPRGATVSVVRRRFLGWLALGAGAALGIGFVRASGYRLPPEIQLGQTKAWHYVVLNAIGARMVAPERVDVGLYADSSLAGFVAADRADFSALLTYVEHIAPFAAGHARRFSSLGPSAQEQVLRSLEQSSVGALRAGFQALKGISMMALYRREESWAAIGYTGPVIRWSR